MLRTIGVVSTLEGDARDEVLRLWKLFEAQYESRGVQSFVHPHISFQGGHSHDVAALEDALSSLVSSLRPFEIVIDGIGVFESPDRVIFLKVVLTDELKSIHQLVNDALRQHCEEVLELYAPERWQPHVTLAMGDLTKPNFERARQDLSEYHPHYRQTITNLRLVEVRDQTGEIEIVKSWTL